MYLERAAPVGKRLATLAAMTLAGCSRTAGPTHVVLQPDRTYQTIVSWEATAQLGDDDLAHDFVDLYRDEVIGYVVDSVGLNGLRVPLRSGTESPVDLTPAFFADASKRPEWRATWFKPENDNDDPFSINESGFQFAWLDDRIEKVVLPMRRLLEARGESLYLNLNYVDFEPSPFEQLAHPEEYAELMLATFEHLRSKYGLTPDAIEVLLEPDVGQVWGPDALAAATVAAGDRLKEHGFEPDFIAPSNTSMSAAVESFDRMLDTPRVLDYLSTLSYHRYRDVSLEALHEIGRRVERYGVRSGMLEHISSGYEDLHADLEVGMASMWQQFVLGWPGNNDNGAAYVRVLDTESGRPRVVPGARTTFLARYFQAIRPGAVRIGAVTDNDRVDPLAFVNVDGTYAVVVKADGPSEVTVEGLPAGTYVGGYTTERGSGPIGPLETDGERPVVTSVPGVGVLSLRGGAMSGGNR